MKYSTYLLHNSFCHCKVHEIVHKIFRCRARICERLRSPGIDSEEYRFRQPMEPEPVFVNLLRSPGIDSQPGGPVQTTKSTTLLYLSYWSARLYRLAKWIPQNRFLCSINVYKYGLFQAGTTNRIVVMARSITRLLKSFPPCIFLKSLFHTLSRLLQTG
jgi:hypothetical protein